MFVGPGDDGRAVGRAAFNLFSVYTISWTENRLNVRLGDKIVHSGFFVREIVHIEAFMPTDDAKGARGHCLRPDSSVTDKSLRSACGPFCRVRPSQAWRRPTSGAVHHERSFRARFCGSQALPSGYSFRRYRTSQLLWPVLPNDSSMRTKPCFS